MRWMNVILRISMILLSYINYIRDMPFDCCHILCENLCGGVSTNQKTLVESLFHYLRSL